MPTVTLDLQAHTSLHQQCVMGLQISWGGVTVSLVVRTLQKRSVSVEGGSADTAESEPTEPSDGQKDSDSVA